MDFAGNVSEVIFVKLSDRSFKMRKSLDDQLRELSRNACDSMDVDGNDDLIEGQSALGETRRSTLLSWVRSQVTLRPCGVGRGSSGQNELQLGGPSLWGGFCPASMK